MASYLLRVSPVVMLIAVLGAAASAISHAEAPVRFNRDVLPILSDNCFTCHGPDSAARKRDLRLDQEAGLLGKTKNGKTVIRAGDPEGSALFARVTHSDPEERMPPAGSHRELSAADIDTLRRWIEEGASWQGHWAFIPPVKPPLPEVSNPSWCQNEIDAFILHRLDAAGLPPAQEAEKETLIRRVSLDLTGLPATPEEVDAFLADEGDDAYEKVVDRLLASPQYGERMAFVWLDAARYSDTNGYQRDTKRDMWAWRDWVIGAFNDNMPFDQFTVDQLAGDLLPDATLSQKIATGFNRNHRINGEGGIIPEEYAVEYVVDRVSTTSTTWMGMTMACAKCHEHKFDPFSQKDFYQFYAFFNQVPENGKGGERGNDVPFIGVPTPEQREVEQQILAKIDNAQRILLEPDAALDAQQQAWEATLREKFSTLAWQPVPAEEGATEHGTVLEREADGSFVATGPNPDQESYVIAFDAERAIQSFQLEILTDARFPETGPGRSANGNIVLTDFAVERAASASPASFERLPIVGAMADFSQDKGEYKIDNAIDADPKTGWATGSHVRREDRTAVFVLDAAHTIQPGDRVRVSMRYNSQYAQHSAGRFRLSESAMGDLLDWSRPSFDAWHHVGPIDLPDNSTTELLDVALSPEQDGFDASAMIGDAGLKWQERPEWVDGVVTPLEGTDKSVHYLYRKFRVAIPTGITLSLGSNDAIKVWLDGQLQLSENVGRTAAADQNLLTLFLHDGEHELLIKIANYGSASGFYFNAPHDGGEELLALMALLKRPEDARSEKDQRQLRNFYRGRVPEWVARTKDLEGFKQELETHRKSIVTTMVMEDMKTPRDTYLLTRGAYDKPDTSEKLYPDVPKALGAMDESLPRNRLGLAKWLLDPAHPLTARVRVNHYWQMYFGRGIVKTSEDFGTQGTPPSHPDLLDWLAVTFVESGWDVKGMQKRIVMSATYRQSSVLTDLDRERDPENILLARAPRTRLSAEMLRDQALKVSGLLNPKLGGPSVKPYQPDAMWSALTFQNMDEFDTNFYRQDEGDKIYRRGLYTYWKRTIAPPRMQIFGVADRERCSLYQERTNTPMQAMVLLNDPTFVEASRCLAQRMINEGGARSDERVRYGYKLALANEPSRDREHILLAGLSDYQSHFNRSREAAQELISFGDSKPDASIDSAELAAYTMLASVILNLDEMITRE